MFNLSTLVNVSKLFCGIGVAGVGVACTIIAATDLFGSKNENKKPETTPAATADSTPAGTETVAA